MVTPRVLGVVSKFISRSREVLAVIAGYNAKVIGMPSMVKAALFNAGYAGHRGNAGIAYFVTPFYIAYH